MNVRTASSVASVLLAALAACTVLPPREDSTRYFVLSVSAAATPSPAANPAFGVVIGPVRLPEYLLRPEIVRRTGENQLEPSVVDRWAEPIDHALVRVLCRDLSSLLPLNSVVAFPVSPPEKAALQVEVEIDSFEGDRAGKVRLEGRWTVRDLQGSGQLVHEFKTERGSSGTETPAIVATMSTLLGELAGKIAHDIGDDRKR